jgi:hypothetical protein
MIHFEPHLGYVARVGPRALSEDACVFNDVQLRPDIQPKGPRQPSIC